MGTMKYLFDSNVVIDFLSGRLPDAGMKFISDIVDNGVAVSVISRIEVLACQLDEEDEKLIRDFLDESLIIDLGEEIADKTISIRKTRRVKIPDAVIAATALVLDLTLLTRNVDDFKGIDGLHVLDPWTKQ
ncbi:MAG: type II toxin-antitoxin system VapC family toxin [Bacteroidales bacterium]